MKSEGRPLKKTALVVNAGTHPEPYQVAVGLAEIGWAVDYLTGSQFAPSEMTRALLTVIPVRLRSFISARLLGDDVTRLNQFFYAGFGFEFLYLLLRNRVPACADKALARRTRRVARRAVKLVTRGAAYDVVIAQHTSAILPFSSAPRGTGRVLLQPILDAGTLNSVLRAEAAANPSWADLLPPPVDAKLQEGEIETADLVITGSELVAQPIRDRYGKPAFSAHYGGPDVSSVDMRRPSDRLGPLQVLFAGQVNQRKGIGYLLDAVRGFEPTLELRVAGQAGDLVKRRAADLPHVTFLGALSRADLEREYRQADVLVLPSLAEGFALVVTEAMSTGLPCIVTNRTGAHEVIRPGENGFVVDAGDTAALRSELERVLADRATLGIVGERARATAGSLTWRKFREAVAVRIDRHQFGNTE
ncbi:starch synthase [Microbacterium sp. SORGH_AS 421]|nr:starch synthase [Microbacterium sp. SORGH_AS_0421]